MSDAITGKKMTKVTHKNQVKLWKETQGTIKDSLVIWNEYVNYSKV